MFFTIYIIIAGIILPLFIVYIEQKKEQKEKQKYEQLYGNLTIKEVIDLIYKKEEEEINNGQSKDNSL